MFSWIKGALHLIPGNSPSWWKGVFAQGEIRKGPDPIGKTSTSWNENRFLIQFFPLHLLPPRGHASFSEIMSQLIKVTKTLNIPPLFEEFVVGQNSCWTKYPRQSGIEFTRPPPPTLPPSPERKSLTHSRDSWLGHYSSHKCFSYPMSQRPSTTL